MTKDTFESIINHKRITWNDIVVINIFNPNYRWTLFRRIPKTIKYEGALGYTKGDNNVELCISNGYLGTKVVYFDFEQIFDIEKKKK